MALDASTKRNTSRRRVTLWSVLRWLLLAGLICEIVACVVLYLIQDGLILPTQKLTAAQVKEIRAQYPALKEMRLTAADGVRLHGWAERGQGHTADACILYFGGQAGEASGAVDEAAQQTGWSVVGFNYRGCGLSEGRPSEKALFADALAIYDALQRERHPRRIVVMGRSLGSGEAVYVAQHRPVAATILIVPYDSIASVGQERYPLIPVRLIIKHPFDSLSRAPSIHTPMLTLAAERDTVIPPTHAQRLAASWGGPTTVKILPKVGHDDLECDVYWRAITRFLSRASN